MISIKKLILVLVLASQIFGCSVKDSQTGEEILNESPIQLNPENQHYFLYKGKPLALITSAEHYGSVINLDFDYVKYLETLARDGMNYTRIFTGTYFEINGESFGIKNNTLAPLADKVITPWEKVAVDKPGKSKYDLSKWNKNYFDRLKDFMTVAAEHDIIVEVTLFSSIYRDKHWDICPQNPANNVNISHSVSLKDAQTLNNGTLIDYQTSFVRKIVKELNEFDNFFFEIQNEPWSDHTLSVYNLINKEELVKNDWTYKADFATEESMIWQEKIASVITEEEKNLDKKHLIAQNYTNYKAPIPVVNNNVSIINFHYAWPEAVGWNYHYNKVIGFDESGFAGSGDKVYRRQAWQFMLSGGALFNNLDYSFYVGHEDGLGENKAPGGGSDTLRMQLKVLSDFLHGFDLEKLYPDNCCIKSSPGLIPYILSDKKTEYAVFLRAIGTEKTTLQLKVTSGNYLVQQINTINGLYSDPFKLESVGGLISIEVLIPDGEMAFKIVKE